MKPKLALFEFRMIGDAVMALPLIQSIRERYDVYVCCTPSGEAVFKMVLPEEKVLCWRPPWVDESKKYSPAKLLKQYPGELLRRLRSLKIEIGVSAWADPRTSLIMLMAGIPRRVGFDLQPQNYYGHERPWRAAGLKKAQYLARVMKGLQLPLLTESLMRTDYLQNHVEDLAQLCRHLGGEWTTTQPWIRQLPYQLPEDLTRFLEKYQQRGPVGIVHCGARTEAKRWPVERFQQLIEEHLLSRNLPVVLIDLPDLKFPEMEHPLVKVYRPETLNAYVALCGVADYAICNDTGSAHLAGATGKPVVTIFTNSRPEWFTPYGNEHLAVEGAPCPHKPCLERCVMPSFICRDGVSVEAVAEKVELCLRSKQLNLKGET